MVAGGFSKLGSSPRLGVIIRRRVAAVANSRSIDFELFRLGPVLVVEEGKTTPGRKDVVPPGNVETEALIEVDVVCRTSFGAAEFDATPLGDNSGQVLQIADQTVYFSFLAEFLHFPVSKLSYNDRQGLGSTSTPCRQ